MIVFDRQLELKDELRDQLLVTVLMVVIITLCIGLMALDMQLMLNPLERITKLIKIVTGKRWRKKMAARKLAQEAQDAAAKKMSATDMLEDFELEAYFALRMVNQFFVDVEEAFSLSMGKYRQKLWALELWFDKLFLFINRILVQMTTAGMTLDELWSQVCAILANEMPALVRKLSGDKVSGKFGAVVRVWMMTARPRQWVSETVKTATLRQMRLTLGPTPAISSRQIELMELRKFLVIRLGAIVRRDLMRMNKKEGGQLKEKSLHELWQMATMATTSIALGEGPRDRTRPTRMQPPRAPLTRVARARRAQASSRARGSSCRRLRQRAAAAGGRGCCRRCSPRSRRRPPPTASSGPAARP